MSRAVSQTPSTPMSPRAHPGPHEVPKCMHPHEHGDTEAPKAQTMFY